MKDVSVVVCKVVLIMFTASLMILPDLRRAGCVGHTGLDGLHT